MTLGRIGVLDAPCHRYEAGADSTRLTVRRTLDDLFELAGELRARFGERRILLVGHSWGSYLGMLAVRERPELFAAFVGTGRTSSDTSRIRALRRARRGQRATRRYPAG